MKAHVNPPAESRLKQTVLLLIRNYGQHNVGKNAAALAYYLLFAIFPLLIFASNLLGLLKLDVFSITQTLSNFLPKDIVGLIESYLDYISHTSGHLLLWFSLVFSIWFPMRAVKGLMDDVRLAHHLSKPPNSLKYRLRQLIYTVVFLVVIILTLALSTLGEHVLGYIGRLLPENTPRISGFIPDFWQYLRFIPMALLMFAALGALYALSMDKRPPIKQILPGIIAALISWMIVSIGFSFYVENFAHYSLIYGTMGAMIVLLMWLYMTALVLILGAEFNAALTEIHS